MKSTVVNNFIDNKITTAFCESKSVSEVIEILRQRIKDTNKSQKMRKAFKDYINYFSEKRIEDILFVRSKENFDHLPNNKILKLIKFRDKISGFSDFEITSVGIIQQKAVSGLMENNVK